MTTQKDPAKRGKSAPKSNEIDVNACILVSKRGTLKEVRTSESEYSKICKTPPTYASAFKRQTSWKIKKYSAVIELWARANGRAGQENAYEFPPPVDETLFFGDCILVSRKYESGTAGSCAPLTIAGWKKMYARLFGGFDDMLKLADADENEIDELEHISDKKKTRDGYLKDSFIVDDGAAAARINIKSELHKMKLAAKPREYADGADLDSEYRDDTSDDDDDDSVHDDGCSPDAVAVNASTAADDSDEDDDDDADRESSDDADVASDDISDNDDDDNDNNHDDDDDDNNGEVVGGCTLRNRNDRTEISEPINGTSGNKGNNNNNNTYDIITTVRGGKRTIATLPSSEPNIGSKPITCTNSKIKQKQPLKLKRRQPTKASALAAAAAAAASKSDTTVTANATSDASELSEEPYEY